MKDLVIIGAGYFGEDMLDNICRINMKNPTWNVLGFVDDVRTGEVDGVKILGTLEDFLKMDKSIQYFVAILDGKVREQIMNICKEAGFTGAVIIDDRVICEEKVEIGQNSFVGFNSNLLYGCKIGPGVIIERGAAVCSEAQIGAYTTFRSCGQIGRSVQIGKYNTFDRRCTVNDDVQIVDGCKFKIGSVVMRDVLVAGQYFGIPAKLVEAAR